MANPAGTGADSAELTPTWFRRTIAPMPTCFDEAFSRVKELVADFRANEKFYLSPAYQEQEARRDFIDKFWLALGWDVNHETQKNPFEQEVKVERKEHGFSQRRADYAFYLAPNFRDVKFYVEAKKPHGDIATADNYFQTARYGWRLACRLFQSSATAALTRSSGSTVVTAPPFSGCGRCGFSTARK